MIFLFALHNTRSLVDSPPLTFGTITNISNPQSTTTITTTITLHKIRLRLAQQPCPICYQVLSLSLFLCLSLNTQTNRKAHIFIRKWELERQNLIHLSLKSNGFTLKFLNLNWVELGYFILIYVLVISLL